MPQQRPVTFIGFLGELLSTLGAWLRGQAQVALCMFALYAAGFAYLDLPFWGLLAFLGGLLHFIPVIGAVLSLILPVVVSLIARGGQRQLLGLLVVFVVAQVLESFVLTPVILGARLRLRPALVFLALLAGGMLFGLLGALFAVPAVAAAVLFWRLLQRSTPQEPPPPS